MIVLELKLTLRVLPPHHDQDLHQEQVALALFESGEVGRVVNEELLTNMLILNTTVLIHLTRMTNLVDD